MVNFFSYVEKVVESFLEVVSTLIFDAFIPIIQSYIPGTSQCVLPTSVQMWVLFLPIILFLYILIMRDEVFKK